MWKAVAVMAIVTATAVAPVSAQQAGSAVAGLKPGTRVRVLIDAIRKQQIVGTVTAARRDTVVLDTVDLDAQRRTFMPAAVVVDEYREIDLPAASIRQVEVSEGRSRVRGALKMGLRGMLIGGLVVGCSEISGPYAQRSDFRRGLVAGGVVGLAIGAPVGYRIGVERWRPAAASGRMVAER